MGKLIDIQGIILGSFDNYKDSYSLSGTKMRYETLIANNGQHFQLIRLGWYKGKRVYKIIAHLEIKTDKIWVQEDNTEEGIATFLLDLGVDKSKIVLAYFSEGHRAHTDFAIG
ncbi:MAG: element excision factor XisI family protein [Bacteroidota bacterium]